MKPELRAALAEKGPLRPARRAAGGRRVRAAGQDRRPCGRCRHTAESLAALGFDARIITPYHRVIKENTHPRSRT